MGMPEGDAEWLSMEDAADALAVHYKTLALWARRGYLPFRRRKGRVEFKSVVIAGLAEFSMDAKTAVEILPVGAQALRMAGRRLQIPELRLGSNPRYRPRDVEMVRTKLLEYCLTLTQAANKVGVSHHTVNKWVALGLISTFEFGKSLFYRPADLEPIRAALISGKRVESITAEAQAAHEAVSG